MTILLGSIAFFLSGFAALVYQIVWQRLLVLPAGPVRVFFAPAAAG